MIFAALFLVFPSSSATEAGFRDGQLGVDYCVAGSGLDVLFLLDNSGSMALDDTDEIRGSAINRFADDLSVPDRMSVITYTTEGRVIQSFTSNRFDVYDAMETLPEDEGGTDLGAGMRTALDEMSRTDSDNKQVMIVMTDGADTINRGEIFETVEEARRQNISIFTVGIGSLAEGLDEELLRYMADQTRGEYRQAPSVSTLDAVFESVYSSVDGLRSPQVYSDWTLQNDHHERGDLVITRGTRMNLNGYDLTVDGDLIMSGCSGIRAVEGSIQASGLDQEADAFINMNESRLRIDGDMIHDGIITVNGSPPDGGSVIDVSGDLNQGVLGHLSLDGQEMTVDGDTIQEGYAGLQGGTVHSNRANTSFTQRGKLDLGGGDMHVSQMVVEGGPLLQNDFEMTLNLDLNGGRLEAARLIQNAGQVYVNRGSMYIAQDYQLNNGWLTMVNSDGGFSTADSVNPTLGQFVPTGDFVDVRGNFINRSLRSTKAMTYRDGGTSFDDVNHLTGGILRVHGIFRSEGNEHHHSRMTDHGTFYAENYSASNFHATGDHRVILTGKTARGALIEGDHSTFHILELEGSLFDYAIDGSLQFRWNHLVENEKSANAQLRSLSLNGTSIFSDPVEQRLFTNQVISNNVNSSTDLIQVEAITDDLNAEVSVSGNRFDSSGRATVMIEVTPPSGVQDRELYEIRVRKAQEEDRVSGITIQDHEFFFVEMSGGTISPSSRTVNVQVEPATANNRNISWSSSDPSVAAVNASGVITPQGSGKATIQATTEEGGYTARAEVVIQNRAEVFEDIDSLADLMRNEALYNRLMTVFNPSDVRVFVPGHYIQQTLFTPGDSLTGNRGSVQTRTVVDSVEVRVNGGRTIVLPQQSSGVFSLHQSLGSLNNGDFIEITARNSAGDVLEKLPTVYPVNVNMGGMFSQSYSLETLYRNRSLFMNILGYVSPEYLQVELR